MMISNVSSPAAFQWFFFVSRELREFGLIVELVRSLPHYNHPHLFAAL